MTKIMDRKPGVPHLQSFKPSKLPNVTSSGGPVNTLVDLEARIQAHAKQVAIDFLKTLHAARIKTLITSNHELGSSSALSQQSLASVPPSGLEVAGSMEDLSRILDLADRFCKTFVDSVAEDWNKQTCENGQRCSNGQSMEAGGDDHSQHGDSGDEEDEMLENSLYQPCPEIFGRTEEEEELCPIDPLYADPSEADYRSLKKRLSSINNNNNNVGFRNNNNSINGHTPLGSSLNPVVTAVPPVVVSSCSSSISNPSTPLLGQKMPCHTERRQSDNIYDLANPHEDIYKSIRRSQVKKTLPPKEDAPPRSVESPVPGSKTAAAELSPPIPPQRTVASNGSTYDSPQKAVTSSLEGQLAEAFALQHSKSVEEEKTSSSNHSSRGSKKRLTLSLFTGGSKQSLPSPQSAPIPSAPENPLINRSCSTNFAAASGGQPKFKEAFLDFTSEMANMLKRSSPKHQRSASAQRPMGGSPLDKVVPMTPAVTVHKEGVVELLIPTAEGQQVWKACRLILLKTHGGMMLNLFLPPESDKPSSGIFCPLIYEAREAKPSEFRSHECIMIIKAEGNVQSVLRCRCYEQRHDWLCVIRDQMKASSGSSASIYQSLDPVCTSSSSTVFLSTSNTSTSLQSLQPLLLSASSSCYSMDGTYSSIGSEPTTPQAVTQNGVQRGGGGAFFNYDSSYENSDDRCKTPTYSSNHSTPTHKSVSQADLVSTPTNENPHPQLMRITSCGEFGDTITPTNSQILYPTDSTLTLRGVGSTISPSEEHSPAARHKLHKYPWFHGQMSRAEAAAKVLQQGSAGHGVYLVRQSETKEDEFCLTFNYQGKAKHLRMSVDPENGICRVQHLVFKSIFGMIEHYRSNPLPIDTKEGVPITLRSYIINLQADSVPQNRASTNPNRVSMHRRNKSVDFNLESSLLDGPTVEAPPLGSYTCAVNGSRTPNPTKKQSFTTTQQPGTYSLLT